MLILKLLTWKKFVGGTKALRHGRTTIPITAVVASRSNSRLEMDLLLSISFSGIATVPVAPVGVPPTGLSARPVKPTSHAHSARKGFRRDAENCRRDARDPQLQTMCRARDHPSRLRLRVTNNPAGRHWRNKMI